MAWSCFAARAGSNGEPEAKASTRGSMGGLRDRISVRRVRRRTQTRRADCTFRQQRPVRIESGEEVSRPPPDRLHGHGKPFHVWQEVRGRSFRPSRSKGTPLKAFQAPIATSTTSASALSFRHRRGGPFSLPFTGGSFPPVLRPVPAEDPTDAQSGVLRARGLRRISTRG